MNDVSTLQEELTRKTLEALEKLASDRENGRITEAQYAYGLNILWTTTAGLVDKDLMLMMELAEVKKEGASFFTREFYLGGKGHIVKITNTHKGLVVLDLSLYDGCSQSRKIYDLRGRAEPHQSRAGKVSRTWRQSRCQGFSTTVRISHK